MICLNLKVTENVLLISARSGLLACDWVVCLNVKVTMNVLLISARSGVVAGIG